MKVIQVIRDSNRDVGGRVVELAETEYMVRGRGYLRGIADLEILVVKAERGTPVLIRDVAPKGISNWISRRLAPASPAAKDYAGRRQVEIH